MAGCLAKGLKSVILYDMVATLSQSQAELARLVEIASQGEEVLITVDGKPKARLTRVDSHVAAATGQLDLAGWLKGLEELRRKNATGIQGHTVEQILDLDRTDRD